MKRFKLAIAAMVIAAGSFAAFAFTSNANMEEEQPPQLKTYWVTEKAGSNFVVSDDPDDAGLCDGVTEPCEIETSEIPNPSTNQLTPEQMSSPNTTIKTRQEL